MSNLPYENRVETSYLKRAGLVPMIVAAATSCIDQRGLEGLEGPIKTVTMDRLSLAFRTPHSMAHGESNYGLDAWYDGKKVFSVCGNSHALKDYEVVNFKRGPWISSLLV